MATGQVSQDAYLSDTLQTPDRGDVNTNSQPTLQDYIGEAQKLGQQSVEAQQGILRQDTKQVGEDLSRSLYGQNVGQSGIGQKVIGKAISDQQKRLEPYAVQAGVETGKQALQQKYEMTNKAIDMAIAGNLTGPAAQQIVSAAFGEGAQITNVDQQDLQNAARASGLTDQEFALMKRAMGTAQWDDIQNNPQDYVENPQRMRNFQEHLAKMQVDAMTESSSSSANAMGSAAGLDAVGNIASSVIGMFK